MPQNRTEPPASMPPGGTDPAPSPIRFSAGDRLLAWLATGPAGRIAAFAWDLAAAWWRWARSRRRRPTPDARPPNNPR